MNLCHACVVRGLFVLVGLGVLPVAAQIPVLGGWSPFGNKGGGFSLHSVWGGVSYFGNASGTTPGSGPRLGLPTDVVTQTGAAVGWTRQGRFPISIVYLPSYVARKNYPEFNRLNHGLRIATDPSTNRDLSSRWIFNMSMNVSFQDMMSSAFDSPFFGGLAGSPDSLSALSSAVNGYGVGGQFPFLLMSLPQQPLGPWGQGATNLQELIGSAGSLTDAEIASRLTGAPVAVPSWTNALYQTRIFTSSVRMGLEYKITPRLSFVFGGTGAFHRYIDSSGQSALFRPFQRSLSAGAFTGVSYSATRGTRIGVEAESVRQFSTLQDGYVSRATLFAERRFQRWFVRGDAGVSEIRTLRQTFSVPNNLQMYWRGSVGLQTTRQTTIIASLQRGAGDAYGVGGATTTSAMLGFRWNRPFSRWSLFASGAQEQLENPAFAQIRMYRVAGGNAWRLGWNLSLQTQLFWMKYNGGSGPLPYNASFRGASVNLVWSPRPERMAEAGAAPRTF